MKILKKIRAAIRWYFNSWIELFIRATDPSKCSLIGPREVFGQPGPAWDPELRKWRRR